MTISAYLPTSGASFSPESANNMGKALDSAVDILRIEPDDETKRDAVARFIIKLAEIDGGVDEASLRDKAVMALSGSVHLASMSKDDSPDAHRPPGTVELRGVRPAWNNKMEKDIRIKLLAALKTMINRCYKPNNARYENYGGRGICVYAEWRHLNLAFLEYVQTLTGWDNLDNEISRIDNNSHYVPGNIHFVIPEINRANTRPRITHAKYDELRRRYDKLIAQYVAVCNKHHEPIEGLDMIMNL